MTLCGWREGCRGDSVRSLPFGRQGIARRAALHLDRLWAPTWAWVGFCFAEAGPQGPDGPRADRGGDTVYSGRMDSEAVFALALGLQGTP